MNRINVAAKTEQDPVFTGIPASLPIFSTASFDSFKVPEECRRWILIASIFFPLLNRSVISSSIWSAV